MSKGVSTNVDKIEEEVLVAPEKVYINIDTPDEDVVRFIQEKKFLIFEHEKGKFKVLPKEILELCDPLTRGSYRASEALNANHSPEADELAKHLKVGGNGATLNAPRDKFTVQVKEGLDYTWARPDMLEEMRAKGWRAATEAEVSSHHGTKVEGHIEVKTGLGITDTVLFVKGSEEHAADRAKKLSDRLALGAAMDTEAEEKVMGTGYKPVKI